MINITLTEDLHSRLLAARLPSPPQALLKLLRICQADQAGMAELSALISQDPAMTAKVLTIARSAAYHRSDSQDITLLQATSTLGTALIKVLVISESVLQTVQTFKLATTTDLRYFWRHSLSVALYARELVRRLDDDLTEQAYLAGLLHDVGRLAMLAAIPHYGSVYFSHLDDTRLCAHEAKEFGLTHSEAGAWLMQQWDMDAQMIDAVLHHHVDTRAGGNTLLLTGIVHQAHDLAGLPLHDPAAIEQLALEHGWETAELASLQQTVDRELHKIAGGLSIDISTTDAQQRPTVKPQAAPVPPPPSTKPSGSAKGDDSQLAHTVLDRTVLNEMAVTLMSMADARMALTSVRQHASVLLRLNDSLVLVLRNNPQMLVPASMNRDRWAVSALSFDVLATPAVARCVLEHQVVFCDRSHAEVSGLLDFFACNRLVLVPLRAAQACVGVLAAAVPDNLEPYIQQQTPLLQAFGLYAGMALSRRHQADKERAAQLALAQREKQLELQHLSKALLQTVRQDAPLAHLSPTTSVDLCMLVTEMVPLLQDSGLVPKHITLRCEVAGRAAFVLSSSEMVRQILLILVSYACDRMTNGGTILIDAGVLVQRDGIMFTVLSVTDAGPGSNQAIQSLLYEPIRNRQDCDDGTLHLHYLGQLIDKLEGRIKTKADESGTQFDVYLPCPTHH